MDNISFQQAHEIAVKKLAEEAPDGRFTIWDEKTKEYPFGWIFICASKKYIETLNQTFQVPGFGPLVVERDGVAEFEPSATSSDIVVKERTRRWNSRNNR